VGVAIRRASSDGGLHDAVEEAREHADDDASAVLDWLSHGASSVARE
jgi:glucokinase